jgi:hypothetical protein
VASRRVATTVSRFSTRRVIEEAQHVIWRRGPSLILLFVLLIWIPPLIARGLNLPHVIVVHTTPVEWFVSLTEPLIFIALAMIGKASVTSIALAELERRPLGMAQAVRLGVQATPALLLFFLIGYGRVFATPFLVGRDNSSLSAFIGLASVVGACIAFAFFGVASSVAVLERLNITTLASRTNILMAQARWYLLVGYIVFRFVLVIPMALVIAWIGPMKWLYYRIIPVLPVHPADIIALPALIFNLIWTVLLAAAYRELLRLRRGALPGDLASVFD